MGSRNNMTLYRISPELESVMPRLEDATGVTDSVLYRVHSQA